MINIFLNSLLNRKNNVTIYHRLGVIWLTLYVQKRFIKFSQFHCNTMLKKFQSHIRQIDYTQWSIKTGETIIFIGQHYFNFGHITDCLQMICNLLYNSCFTEFRLTNSAFRIAIFVLKKAIVWNSGSASSNMGF